MLPVGEFDDDQVPGPVVFDDLDIAAMDDKAPASVASIFSRYPIIQGPGVTWRIWATA